MSVSSNNYKETKQNLPRKIVIQDECNKTKIDYWFLIFLRTVVLTKKSVVNPTISVSLFSAYWHTCLTLWMKFLCDLARFGSWKWNASGGHSIGWRRTARSTCLFAFGFLNKKWLSTPFFLWILRIGSRTIQNIMYLTTCIFLFYLKTALYIVIIRRNSCWLYWTCKSNWPYIL